MVIIEALTLNNGKLPLKFLIMAKGEIDFFHIN